MPSPDLVTVYHRPVVTAEEAAALAREHWGLVASGADLPSERDRNVRLTTGDGTFVLKVSHAGEAQETLEFQHAALARAAEREPDLVLPRVRLGRDGRDILTLDLPDGRHLARVITWVPGIPLARVPYHSPELLESLGAVVATLDRALEGWHHPGAPLDLKWDPAHALWVRGVLDAVADPVRRAMVSRHLDRFERDALTAFPTLPRGVIHNDANDWNVLTRGALDRTRVVALVDFGDMVESVMVADLATACAYAMLGKRDPLEAASSVVAGYQTVRPLGDKELAVLFPMITARLAVSVVNAAHQRRAVPKADAYLTVSEAPAWDTLDRLEAVHPRLAHYVFRHAAGFEPCPAAAPVRAWLHRNRDRLGPVIPGLEAARLSGVDLSMGSALIANPPELDDMRAFTRKLFGAMDAEEADVGIGRWDEARAVYSTEAYRDLACERDMPRTVHIGLDLFATPGTPVLAPLDGVVASVCDNDAARDYGPTVILRHDADGIPVFTLYGHLSRGCLDTLGPGMHVSTGQQIAEIGDIEVNGGWSPHLHFQIITDLLDREGEFPGVARPDRRAVWKSLSPDPALMLRLPSEVLAPPRRAGPALRTGRQAHLGPSLSLSYRRPLTIVRGWKQWLYDENGLAYLDCVNNIAHVGHGHPAVVRAAHEQMAVLNTNTRYLHEHVVRYAERLVGTLPPSLEVCFFVNSGSEANELALRLARAATGRRGMVVVDAAYHGNTTSLVDVSPYKHDGPGGAGPPAWVRKVPLPDGYRGLYRSDNPQAGLRYAAHVDEAIRALAANGEPPAAFLAESVLSCAGQIVLPDGFLAEAYRRMRAAGGVCIADEVQVGFGRVGTRFWAFETQGVVPDIVTLGKPIGNGHPIGAVVTTRAIAEAFANGMEFFSSFGGNPVSCAVGLAVLDVIEREGLQAHAMRVGSRFLDGLAGLGHRHAVVGEARGLGLFLGLELVRDRETREPAGPEAAYVVNRLRDRGVLLSTDGPFHNVLKIKPPMCFDEADADRVVRDLDVVLAEISPPYS